MRVDPITSPRPTNADLAKGFNQLHACHEDTKEKVVEIQHALGITPGGKRVAGLSTPFKAFIRTAGATATAIGGLLLFYRAAVAIWPSAWAFLLALNHAVLSGKF